MEKKSFLKTENPKASTLNKKAIVIFTAAIIFITIDQDQIDVNIHPKKEETYTLTKTTVWKGLSGGLLILLVISLFTGGFGLGKDSAQPTILPTQPTQEREQAQQVLSKVNLEKKIDKFKLASIKGKAEDLEDLIDDNEIEFLELDQDVEILGDNIPLNIQKTKADTVWNLSNGSGVKVAVLDTGIALHDDLAIAGGVSFVDDNYYDSNGHGTAVAGFVAGLLNNQGLV